MPNIWNAQTETMPRGELEKLQLIRLQDTVGHIYKNVPAYKKKMDKAGIAPSDIKSLKDLGKLPFTYKQDLRDAYPYDMFAVPMDDIVRIHASSGTTGKQTVVGYTQDDIDAWGEVMARSLTAHGADKSSIMHVAYGYGLFTGGLGAHQGGTVIGASTIPVSGGNSKRQVQIMVDFKSTHLACTPSYALALSEVLKEQGYTKEDLSLKAGTFGAEAWTENMRCEIEDKLGIDAYDIYGLSEIMGPGVSYECECKSGLHVNEDHFIPEIIDPDTEEILPAGSRGELVFTTITKKGFPLIRYRTRDIASLCYEKCHCGRTFVRMSKPMGRSDDMLIIRGVNVFPSQIESVIMKIDQISPHYQLIVDRVGTMDTLEVRIEVDGELFSDEVKQLEALERKVKADIESLLGISAKIRLVEPKSIARSEGKAVRVIDNRKLL